MEKAETLLVEAFILLERQFLLVEHLIESQSESLKIFEEAVLNKRQNIKHVLAIYNYVFALIDYLERYRKIANTIPTLNKKSSEYRALKDALEGIKDVRNQHQHLNNDIINEFTGPLLGSVCWISSQKHFMAALSDVSRERSMYGIVFDRDEKRYMQEFCYAYNEKYCDLGKAIKGTRVFHEFITSKVEIQKDGRKFDAKEHFIALLHYDG